MTDLVKCDRCGTPFSIQTAGIRATWSGDYMVQYFTCPGCHHRYQILTTDTELRQTIQRHKAIAAKIKLGQTKHFRPGTLKSIRLKWKSWRLSRKSGGMNCWTRATRSSPHWERSNPWTT